MTMGLMSTFGICIGMSISKSSELIDCIFMSLAGGMLLFISCSEIIVHEFEKGKGKYLKILMIILGILFIAMLWFLHGAAHAHGEEESYCDALDGSC